MGGREGGRALGRGEVMGVGVEGQRGEDVAITSPPSLGQVVRDRERSGLDEVGGRGGDVVGKEEVGAGEDVADGKRRGS